MKILHTADLHLGQTLYQRYERAAEHRHFFKQLQSWCKSEKPDALVVSGDIFDIPQPSAQTKKAFNDYFVELHRQSPGMTIIVVAGNHDSATRVQADNSVWALSNVHVIGTAPAIELMDGEDGWQDRYIVQLESGYIVALPYMIGNREQQIQSILDRVARRNQNGLPVVMTGHLAVTGLDATGHDFEIGTIKTQDISELASGYDYAALGHIHKPQTIGHQDDCMKMDVTYPSAVVRYSGSALHVSCDEKYPHTVSLIELDKRGGQVRVRQLRIDELMHFYELPLDGGSFHSETEAMEGIRNFLTSGKTGYIRLRVDYKTNLSANFTQAVYDLLGDGKDIESSEAVRYNPKIIWTDQPAQTESSTENQVFEIAELQQMNDPIRFVEKTLDQYPELTLEEIKSAFEEVKEEMKRMSENQ